MGGGDVGGVEGGEGEEVLKAGGGDWVEGRECM